MHVNLSELSWEVEEPEETWYRTYVGGSSLAPILMPLAQEIGMNEIHFCIFMITSLGIGFITPPSGLNLFIVSRVSGTPVLSISRHAIYFVFSMLAIVFLMMTMPAISLWLL